MYFLAKIPYIFYLLIFLKAVCCSRVISNLALHFRLFFLQLVVQYYLVSMFEVQFFIYYFFTIFFGEFSLIITHGYVVIKLNMNIA